MARDNHSDRKNELRTTLTDLDGAGYGGYKRLRGTHRVATPNGTPVTLSVDKVQSDPFAPPSLVQASIPFSETGIATTLLDVDISDIPVRDHLTRRIASSLREHNPSGGKGSGFLAMDTPGQQVLDRSSVVISVPDDRVTVRLEVALPAQGRRIRGRAAAALLCEVLPTVVQDALLDLDTDALDAVELAHETYLDQEFLRGELDHLGLVGFVADGSVLPRAAGNSQHPLTAAVPFSSPESLRYSVTLPSGRTVTGLGVPKGVTLIVGGGYHGKSTLLNTLELGIYNHVPGDGREFAVTDADAVSLRAEDGRAVTDVDISPFLHDLPGAGNTPDTRCFSTTNASGSTSQAAGLVEALDSGATSLLIDEDTSATNFMIRDDRMRALVPSAKEPITPLVDRVRSLWEDHGVSTVLVAGGSGMFIDVADTVIMLDNYRPVDVTQRARELAEPAAGEAMELPARRAPGRTSFSSPGRGGKGPRPPQAKGLHSIRVGEEYIDLSAWSQLVDPSQTNAVAAALGALDLDGSISLSDLVDAVVDRVGRDGLEALSAHGAGRHPGRLAGVRRHEIAAAVNRYRGLRKRK
ncbi:ABC-ATPase domain-containing protein [Corynebacterium glyciniphilum]|uniref:ABC-ATPase domain-containing protein n=3 Tax=Corynebacterium glyciniphilum TaxID=1404244 RepID=UPI00264CE9F1|nr:ABC-ATPase domain-containing protein [Corynebacterium glyciniphilum]MDN6706112.1 ABC-ATPase domain-containing protein [Corynebacterium glyciniphilum]